MATKILAAQNRLFRNIFICKRCRQKMRMEPLKVLSGNVSCRKCKGKDFRTPRKK
jgi:DNA polymerase II large subunit